MEAGCSYDKWDDDEVIVVEGWRRFFDLRPPKEVAKSDEGCRVPEFID